MKYVIGAVILSFGLLFVIVAVLMTVQLDPPENIWQILGIAWLVLAVLLYPLARKVIR